MDSVNTCVIFGGTGFIGTHLAQHFLEQGVINKTYVADLKPPRTSTYAAQLQDGLAAGKVIFVPCDVRSPLTGSELPKRVDLIVNLAAVHREPGHEEFEYFATNVPGATNVSEYAIRAGCNRIAFMSSIAPYGYSELPLDESSKPNPVTAYGKSKLQAEEIHRAWQAGSEHRQLLILRPGVVFGAGDYGGNVERLVRSVVGRYFVYTGNRATRKAGGYVKELCGVVEFALAVQAKTHDNVILANFSLDPPFTVQALVEAVCRITGIRRRPLSVPRKLLVALAYAIERIPWLGRMDQPIDPVRMRKLLMSTNIEPRWLRSNGYRFRFTLDQALSDWRLDCPELFD